MRQRAAYARSETEEDDTDTALSGDDAVFYRARQRAQEPGLGATLRERLFGKGKGRADASGRVRFITTAPGLRGAGETETEGEDGVSLQLFWHDVGALLHQRERVSPVRASLRIV